MFARLSRLVPISGDILTFARLSRLVPSGCSSRFLGGVSLVTRMVPSVLCPNLLKYVCLRNCS